MCPNTYERRTIKILTTAGEVPTVAPSNNHQDGSWSRTDIYEGEFCINLTDKIIYIRAGSDIIVLGSYTQAVKEYKAIVNQTGNSAPTFVAFKNDIGAIVWTYTGNGSYLGTLANAFPQDKTFVLTGNPKNNNERVFAYRASDDEIVIESLQGGINTNSVIVEVALYIIILP